MNKRNTTIVCILLTVGITVSLVFQNRAETKLSARHESLRRQAAQLTELSLENGRLSNLVAQMETGSTLSEEQLGQLLRLRSEVGQLRQAGKEKAELQAVNDQLRARETKARRRLAEARAAPNYWAKDQLTFAGYADPESTMRSLLWMMQSGDMSSWRAACTPAALSQLEQKWEKRGMSEAARMAEMKLMADALTSRSSGFHILEKKMSSPDEAVINLSFDGEDKARKFVLRKIGNEWKFHDVIFTGQGA